jgi:DNA-binding NtrC family response regulator
VQSCDPPTPKALEAEKAILIVGGRGEKERATLAAAGYAMMVATDAETADTVLQHEPVDLVVLHDGPPGFALEWLAGLRAAGGDHEVLVIADTPEIPAAAEALRLAAADYLAAPVSPEALLAKVRGTLSLPGRNAPIGPGDALAAAGDYEFLWRNVRKRYGFDHVPSRNPETRASYIAGARVARSSASVIIEGETGTGKEYLSRAIHYLSDRRDEKIVTINCAAIPEALLESELFGHEKGAFTSATARKIGLCEEAHRGTLFLDEIGELSPAMQGKLLRFLQDRSFVRLGGTQPVDVDVRVIAATNRDLERSMEQGLFREDLYYRLSVLCLKLQPLRNRPEDILCFARHCLQQGRKRWAVLAEAFSARAEDELLRHPWPGNLRELNNVVQRAMLMAEGRVIEPRHLMLRRARQAALSLEWGVSRQEIGDERARR